jgi:hypothetical protein
MDFGFWILDFGFWILDFGFKVQFPDSYPYPLSFFSRFTLFVVRELGYSR